MLPNRGLRGYTEAPGLAPHKALGLSTSNCSTGPFLLCSGGSRDEQGRSEFGPKSVSSPAYPGQVAPVWEVLQKKKKKDASPYSPRKFCPLFQTHSSRPEEERGGGGKSFGAFSRTKLKDPTLEPPPSPSLGRASAQSPSSPQTHTQRGPETPLVSPRDPQEGGGRYPLPTENSHFFAARFRNTPGLMPSGELCNQGHHSRAKQTRLCVCGGGPGEAHWGREGLRSGLGVALVCSAKAAGGRRAKAPRAEVPGPANGRGPTRSGQPGLGPSPTAAAPASGR